MVALFRPAALAAVLLLLAVAPAAAQSQTLVANVNQTRTVGTIAVTSFDEAATRFFTGGNASGYDGYELLNVGLHIDTWPTGQTSVVTVRIFTTDADGVPDAVLYTLTPPSTRTNGAVNFFRAPSGATLEASRLYAVVVTTSSHVVILSRTISTNEDTGGAIGWNIRDPRLSRDSGASWITKPGENMLIRIRGAPKLRDTTPPTLVRATLMNGEILRLVYDEELNADSVPASSAFIVSVDGGTGVRPSAVTISGSRVALTLQTPVTAGQSVTVNYVPTGNNRIQDAEGNEAIAFSGQTVINTTPAAVALEVTTASTTVINGGDINFEVAPDIAPGRAFRVRFDLIAAGDNPVRDPVDDGVGFRDAINPPESSDVIDDPDDNVDRGLGGFLQFPMGSTDAKIVRIHLRAASSSHAATVGTTFSIRISAVSGVTPSWVTTPVADIPVITIVDPDDAAPMLLEAAVNGGALTLTYNEALDESSVPNALSYEVAVGGNITVAGVSGVAVADSTVRLTLNAAVSPGQTVTVSYQAPTGTGAAPIRDLAGNPAADLDGRAVTNDTPAATTIQTLVSNTGQAVHSSTTLNINSRFRQAQTFTTGANTHGYLLETVGLRFSDAPSGGVVTLGIWSTTGGGAPNARLHRLGNPATFTAGAVNTFTAFGAPLLDPNTTYAVVASNTGTGSASGTSSDAEDSGSADGFSIANRRYFSDGGGAWRGSPIGSTSEPRMQISIRGGVYAASPTPPSPVALSAAAAGGATSIAEETGSVNFEVTPGTAPSASFQVDWSLRAAGGNPVQRDPASSPGPEIGSTGNWPDFKSHTDPDQGGGAGLGKSGTLTFLPGSTEAQIIRIEPFNDAIDDGGETFSVTFANPGFSWVTVPTDANVPILTITDDDFDETAPALSSASVDGATLTLVYDETLDPDSAPPASAFSVSIDGGAAANPTAAAVAGSTVRLTLASTVTLDQTVTVSYTVPTEAGANPIQDLSGNAAAAFANHTINRPPVVSNALVHQSATVGAPFAYTFAEDTFTDPDGDTLTYTTGILPTWMTFTPATRTFSGTPTRRASSIISVTANDGNGGAIVASFSLFADFPNNAPTLANPIPDQKATAGAAFSYAFPGNTFNDADGDDLTYTAMQIVGVGDPAPLPTWLTFDASARSFSGTPAADDEGSLTIEVTADDGDGGTVISTFDITVLGAPGVTVSEAALTVAENAGTGAYTVVLDAEPSGDVTITAASGDAAVATVSPTELTFTTANWETAQTVTVTGVDDASVNAPSRTTTIVHAASGGGYDGVTVGGVEVTARDDDGAGVTVAPMSLTVAEAGGMATYELALNQAPTGDVTITVASGDTTVVKVSPTALTFPASDWETAQTVTVTGVDDAIVNMPDRAATITHAVSGYGAVTSAVSVSVTVEDDENSPPAAANPIPDQSATVGEAFSYAFPDNAFSDPDDDPLTYEAAQDDDSALPSWLTFDADARAFSGTPTAGDAGAVSVKVTAADGRGGEASDTFDIVVTAPPPGVTVTPTSLSVAEAGGAAAYTVVLDALPTGDVTVTPMSNDTNSATVSPGSLTFTTENWDAAQTVTVTGVDDASVNAPARAATIAHAASGGGYDGVTVASVAVTLTDDDTADPAPTNPAPTNPGPTNPGPTNPGPTNPGPTNPGPTNPGPTNPAPPAPPARTLAISQTSITVAEGASATWTVALGSQPTGAVTVTPVSGDANIATVAPASLTFATSNWSAAQTVIVTGVDDGVAGGGDREATIGHDAAGGGYSLNLAHQVTVTVTDGATSTDAEADELPTEVELSQNYPNPFNPRTTIEYALPQAGAARLVVYDMLGQEVAVLHDGPQPAGRHAARFDADRLPNGAYVYRLTAGGETIARTMALVK